MMAYPQSLEAAQKREPKLIIAAVAAFRGVSIRDLTGPCKNMRLVWPRHEISAMLREYTTLSWAAMGAAIGGRDHTTTLNSYNRVSARIAQDAGYADQIGRLKAFVGTFGEPARQQASHLISTARKAMHGTASNKDVSTLAITLLSIASLLGDETLTDAEARQACMALSKNVAVSA